MKGKISLSDAIDIRVRVHRGEPAAELAREYQLTRGAVSAIVNRRVHSVRAITQSVRRNVERERHGGNR